MSAVVAQWVEMSELRLAGAAREVLARRLLTRCGTNARLVIDTVLPASELVDFIPGANVADLMNAETRDAVAWLSNEPLWSALQEAGAINASTPVTCRICSPPLKLHVVQLSRSGSMAEGFHDFVLASGGTSDCDIMHQLDGDFRWMAEPVAETGVEPGLINPESAPQLWAEPTGSPGFVRLRWARTSRCAHDTLEEALSPDSVRQMMRDTKLVLAAEIEDVSCSGPATNALHAYPPQDGGVDSVPCLHLRWWPDKQGFLNRSRMTDFPPAAVRRDICTFGVHLVPTRRPGSATELSEWRLSFSRAETVAAYHMSVKQRTTVKSVKHLKIGLKASGAAPALKSYYIKTAVLWLVQDEPSESWESLTDAVQMVLDWLERHLTAGRIPCFFWAEIDLLSGLSEEKVEDMTRTVRMMRSQGTRLLMSWCVNKFSSLEEWLLEDGSEPLSERQLRLRLALMLVVQAVMNGIFLRPTAPCWHSWSRSNIPPLLCLSESRLLTMRHRQSSGAYQQQCFFLEALVVAPAGLLGSARREPPDSDLFTWDVTPLMALFVDADLDALLVDPAAVSDWCRRQLRRSPAERPAGLPAKLNTPLGRAKLLLQPELLLQAFSEVVPTIAADYRQKDEELVELWEKEFQPLESYQDCRDVLRDNMALPAAVLEARLRERLPERSGEETAAAVRLYRSRMQYLLSGDQLRSQYDAVTTRCADRWQLRQFVVPTGSEQPD